MDIVRFASPGEPVTVRRPAALEGVPAVILRVRELREGVLIAAINSSVRRARKLSLLALRCSSSCVTSCTSRLTFRVQARWLTIDSRIRGNASFACFSVCVVANDISLVAGVASLPLRRVCELCRRCGVHLVRPLPSCPRKKTRESDFESFKYAPDCQCSASNLKVQNSRVKRE